MQEYELSLKNAVLSMTYLKSNKFLPKIVGNLFFSLTSRFHVETLLCFWTNFISFLLPTIFCALFQFQRNICNTLSEESLISRSIYQPLISICFTIENTRKYDEWNVREVLFLSFSAQNHFIYLSYLDCIHYGRHFHLNFENQKQNYYYCFSTKLHVFL